MIKLNDKFGIIYFSIALALFSYLVLKAIKCPVFIDEAWLTDYINLSYSDIIFYQKEANNTNNHLLTTLWFKIIYRLFGLNLFLIRLPSLISFLLYAWFLKKLIGCLNLDFLYKLTLSMVLLFNYLFTQYFYLARGYGISLALFTVCLYLVLDSATIHNKYVKFGSITFICFLMSLGNFSFVFPALAIEAALLYSVLIEWKPNDDYSNRILVYTIGLKVIFCSFVLLYILPIGKSISSDFPVVTDDFIGGSLVSIAISQVPDSIVIVSNTLIFLFFFFIVITIYQSIIKYQGRKSLLLSLIALLIVCQYFINYYVFHVKFPLERLLIPLLFLFLLLFYLNNSKVFILNSLLLILSLAIVSKFLATVLETKFYRNIYRYDANVELIIDDVERASHGKQCILAASYESIKNCKYFLLKKNIQNVQLVLLNKLDSIQIEKCDFLLNEFIYRSDLEKFKSFKSKNYYWPSQSYLLMNLHYYY